MSNLINRLRLAKLLQAFAEITTEDGTTFSYEGDLEVGTEVFTTDPESNELVPVTDGEYVYDGKVFTVVAGKVTVIEEHVEEAPAEEEKPAEEEPAPEEAPAEEEPAPVEEEENPVEEEEKPAEEPAPEEEEPVKEEEPAAEEEVEKDNIDELKAAIEEKDARIAELEAEIAELKEKIAKAEEPVDEPAEDKFSKQKEIKVEKNEYNIVGALRQMRENGE